MKPLTTCKQLKSFMRRVFYVRRFMQALIELLELFDKLLNKNAQFQWDEEQKKAFRNSRMRFPSPMTVILIVKGVPL